MLINSEGTMAATPSVPRVDTDSELVGHATSVPAASKANGTPAIIHDFDEAIVPPPDSAKWTKFASDVIPVSCQDRPGRRVGIASSWS